MILSRMLRDTRDEVPVYDESSTIFTTFLSISSLLRSSVSESIFFFCYSRGHCQHQGIGVLCISIDIMHNFSSHTVRPVLRFSLLRDQLRLVNTYLGPMFNFRDKYIWVTSLEQKKILGDILGRRVACFTVLIV